MVFYWYCQSRFDSLDLFPMVSIKECFRCPLGGLSNAVNSSSELDPMWAAKPLITHEDALTNPIAMNTI